MSMDGQDAASDVALRLMMRAALANTTFDLGLLRARLAVATPVNDGAPVTLRARPASRATPPNFHPDGEAARPFLKWVGGKRGLLPMLCVHAPGSFRRYHEPFVGGGALFFHLAQRRTLPSGAVLSDNNERLIRAYRGVRDDVESVIRHLGAYPHDKGFYLRMRERPIDGC